MCECSQQCRVNTTTEHHHDRCYWEEHGYCSITAHALQVCAAGIGGIGSGVAGSGWCINAVGTCVTGMNSIVIGVVVIGIVVTGHFTQIR